MELRRKIVEAYEKNEGTYFQLAQRFGVGEATVYRLLKLKREQGNVKPGTSARVTEQEMPEFVLFVSELPNATLEQLKDAWILRTRRQVSRSSIVRALRRAGIARKKAHDRPIEPGFVTAKSRRRTG